MKSSISPWQKQHCGSLTGSDPAVSLSLNPSSSLKGLLWSPFHVIQTDNGLGNAAHRADLRCGCCDGLSKCQQRPMYRKLVPRVPLLGGSGTFGGWSLVENLRSLEVCPQRKLWDPSFFLSCFPSWLKRGMLCSTTSSCKDVWPLSEPQRQRAIPSYARTCRTMGPNLFSLIVLGTALEWWNAD
jgi:hypothetical protein